MSTKLRIRTCNFKGTYFVTLLVLYFLIINKTLPCKETCVHEGDQSICYYEIWDSYGVDWKTAWQLCNSRNSTLPIVSSIDEQNVFAKFLKVHVPGSTVWTSGKNYTYDYWTWVAGQSYSDQNTLVLSSPHRRHQPAFARATPREEDLLFGEHSSRLYHYTCQYSGSVCSQFNDAFEIQNGCIRYSDDKRSWYDARNQCLITGGDLAVLEHKDRLLLRDYFKPHDYWIGLRKTSWRWNLHQQAREEDEIKWTNWSDDWDPMTGNCISIDTSTGKWKAIGCSEKLRVVCQRDFVNTTSLHSESTGSLATAEPDSQNYSTIISVAVGCICVIVISNIFIALVVRKYIYQDANSASVRGNRCYYELETTRRLANSDDLYTELPVQPVYEEVYDNIHHM